MVQARPYIEGMVLRDVVIDAERRVSYIFSEESIWPGVAVGMRQDLTGERAPDLSCIRESRRPLSAFKIKA